MSNAKSDFFNPKGLDGESDGIENGVRGVDIDCGVDIDVEEREEDGVDTGGSVCRRFDGGPGVVAATATSNDSLDRLDIAESQSVGGKLATRRVKRAGGGGGLESKTTEVIVRCKAVMARRDVAQRDLSRKSRLVTSTCYYVTATLEA